MKRFIQRIALIVVAGCALAACQAADGTSQAPDVAMVDSLMRGIGAVNPNDKPIEYKPRAPLAMPADASKLPQPETAVAGASAPNWPSAGQNASLAKVQAIYATNAPEKARELGAPLTPEQMRGIDVISRRERNLAAEKRDEEIISGSRMTLEEQKVINAKALDTAEALRNGTAGESTSSKLAKRRYLTEPPLAYSTPAGNAPLPESVKVEQKPTNYDIYDSAPLDMRCLEENGGDCRRR